ncbi:MAG TPA: nicotinate-nucleotide--dimethylbenzimidazole phosphoribosyltransferase [Mycobacteriales bacterium]|nr:nicotinate-nucleotide--dimethylbenzimidazole phosphoribosyltransferase [Mycobacteriales bacterium]
MGPDDVSRLAAAVGALDEDAMATAYLRQGRLTKPTGALGKLEGLSLWLAGIQRTSPPRPFARKRLVVFAGDHGVTARGVSAYPAEVTAQMVRNLVAGGAAANVIARRVGVGVRVLDLSVDGDLADLPDDVRRHHVRRGSGAIDREPALTDDEVRRAFAAGAAVADEEVDAGADLLIAGDMGIGNSTVAAALVCAVTGSEPVDTVGRGTGIDDVTWSRKVAAVRDALRRSRHRQLDPLGLLRELGGADVAAMSGYLLGAAARRTPVVLDGVVSGAAAVVVSKISPAAVAFLAAGHRSTEPAHGAALTYLGLEPLLTLDLRLGEGTGALLAVPLLDAAADLINDMATFDDAGVSDRG